MWAGIEVTGLATRIVEEVSNRLPVETVDEDVRSGFRGRPDDRTLIQNAADTQQRLVTPPAPFALHFVVRPAQPEVTAFLQPELTLKCF